MENTYFNHFCELLDHNTPLDTYTANSFYYKLKFEILKPLKSEINKNLMNLEDDGKRKYYLEFLLSEIENQDYVKEAGINYIQKHLETYDVKIQDILDFKLHQTNPDFCYKIIDIHYKDLRKNSPEKDEAYYVQFDFINYFSKIMAVEVIDFINEKLIGLNPIKVDTPNETKQISNSNNSIIQTCLQGYGNKISNYELLTKEYNFYNFYNLNIVNLGEELKDEITENLLSLDSEKHLIYLDLVCETLEKSPFFNIKPTIIDKWLVKYEANIDEFPNFKGSELYKLLKINDYYNQIPHNEFFHIESVQEDFYLYFSMIEANKLLEHTNQLKKKYLNHNSLKGVQNKKIKWMGKPSQLGYIIGVLADLDYVEPPIKPNGDINYTQFSKDLLEIFDVETTEGSLSKYLNLNSEKSQETYRKFEENNFSIPHKKIVS